jgi:ABC-type cobalamin/Fe3+-siderophores transport system ATPase subunit
MEDIRCEQVSFRYPNTSDDIFQDVSLALSPGTTALVGPNGSGKSTLLLLAAGILLPTSGTIFIRGINTSDLRDEEARQQYVSFIFQNMEFETEDTIHALLQYVHDNGFRDDQHTDLIDRLIDVFELESCVDRKTQEVSKGELQRTILAFSLLYGSRIVMMDEPIFAMDEYQKHRAMQFMTEFAQQEQMSLYYSVHELELSQRYSDYALLFQEEGAPLYGPTSEILTRERLEQVYGVPLIFLKQKQLLYRDTLQHTGTEVQKHLLN